MDGTNGECVYPKRNQGKGESRLELVCLKDVPHEVRRREAKEPIFLTRYE